MSKPKPVKTYGISILMSLVVAAILIGYLFYPPVNTTDGSPRRVVVPYTQNIQVQVSDNVSAIGAAMTFESLYSGVAHTEVVSEFSAFSIGMGVDPSTPLPRMVLDVGLSQDGKHIISIVRAG